MAGLFDKAFDKAKDFANTEKGESVTDSILDKAAALADKATGGAHTDQIRQGREQADKHLGRE